MTSQPSPPASLKADIAAYDQMRDVLEADHLGKWVVFHEKEFVDAYDSLALAAYDAEQRFGNDSFLIRQVGEESPARLSSHIQYGFAHA